MDNQVEPSKYLRKREDFEIERDRVLVSELAMKGWGDTAIADYLNNRPGIAYTLSRQQIGYDRRKLLDQLHKEQQENTSYWVTEQIMRLNMVEKEAWNAWERSIGKVEDQKIIESLREIARDDDDQPVMDMVVERIERAIRNQVGDKAFLDVILKCIDERAKLLGLHKFQVKVEQETTHMIKMYQGWNPAQAWGPGNGEIIEGESYPKLTNGS